ncbi:hypothetical protein BDQ12DRAFT_217459 [Crucibulum laeve]|uniref:DUF6533 domain-containing protein n=1 Tax=Crucibulum laeve TaxID=68775 RepID=A0A5C3LGK8_9AGAR|nr:hypothetical protein BDQ12DRAFT_217459 [Crucibulum laeve]
MGASQSDAVVWAAYACKGVSIGALAIQVYELFTCLPDEIKYLWKCKFSATTYLYTWSRYVPLCAQIINVILSEMVYAASPSNKICIGNYIFKAVAGQLSLTCVEMIILLRVYALYNRSRRITYFLGGVFLTGLTLQIIGSVMLVTSAYTGPILCSSSQASTMGLSLFAAGACVNETIMLFMTFLKVFGTYRDGWGRTPLVSVMIRDGLLVFVLLSVIISTMISFELVQHLSDSLWNTAFSCYIASLSITGCRLILKMRRLSVRNMDEDTDMTEIQFTSVFRIENSL